MNSINELKTFTLSCNKCKDYNTSVDYDVIHLMMRIRCLNCKNEEWVTVIGRYE